jgi:hypothetical protein
MLKDFDGSPIEPARRRAERRWRNHDVEKRYKEVRAKPQPEMPSELEIADVISNSKPDGRSTVIRAQTKFAKFIKSMLEGHSKQNQERIKLMYILSIRTQRKRLLMEKLRRLEAREAERVALQNQGASNV